MERLQPDVVLMDLSMPVMEGVEAHRAHPPGLATDEDRGAHLVLRPSACAGGARGRCRGLRAEARRPRSDPGSHRCGAPRRGAHRPAGGASAARREAGGRHGERACSPIARRRCCVWCSRAWRTSRSAAGSGISERTVKAHLTKIFQTLGVADRTQAALWAAEHLPAARSITRPSSAMRHASSSTRRAADGSDFIDDHSVAMRTRPDARWKARPATEIGGRVRTAGEVRRLETIAEFPAVARAARGVQHRRDPAPRSQVVHVSARPGHLHTVEVDQRGAECRHAARSAVRSRRGWGTASRSAGPVRHQVGQQAGLACPPVCGRATGSAFRRLADGPRRLHSHAGRPTATATSSTIVGQSPDRAPGAERVAVDHCHVECAHGGVVAERHRQSRAGSRLRRTATPTVRPSRRERRRPRRRGTACG